MLLCSMVMKFLWMACISVSALLVGQHLTSWCVWTSLCSKSSSSSSGGSGILRLRTSLLSSTTTTKSSSTIVVEQQPKTTTKQQPVHMLVCTEALCPDCQEFVQQDLQHAMEVFGKDDDDDDNNNDYQNVFELHLVPFGNAQIVGVHNHKLTCQHGQRECDANAWEQCALYVYPDIHHHWPFVQCLYRQLPMGGHHDDVVVDPPIVEECAIQTQLSYERLHTCRSNPELSWKLQQQAAAATPLYHDHVPWIELNHHHYQEEEHSSVQDFIQEICKAYQKVNHGEPPHSVCLS